MLVLLSFALHFCLVFFFFLFFFHFGLFSHFLLPFITTFTSYINSMYSLLTILCECEKSHFVFINHLYYIVCTFSNINEGKFRIKITRLLQKHSAKTHCILFLTFYVYTNREFRKGNINSFVCNNFLI